MLQNTKREKDERERERERDCQESYTQLSNTTDFIASSIRMTMGIFFSFQDSTLLTRKPG